MRFDASLASACPAPSPRSTGTADGVSGVWLVEEGALAGYRVKEIWNSVTLPHEAVARTNRVRGWALVTGAAPEARLEQACFAVDLSSLHSVDPPALPGQQVSGRDEALGLVLDYAKHPVARLTIGSTVIRASTGGSTAHATIPGALEIAGVVRPVTFDTQIQLDAEAVSIAGKTGITRDDFQIRFEQGAPVDIDQHVTIEFSLVMRRP
jgi:YceI-like protein